MRRFRALVAPLVCLLLSGCGYVHFGRLPESAQAMGDAKAAAAYSDLATDHKILKQELALAHREGDTLRAALERARAGTAPAASASPALVADLNATAAELARLRASHARLQAEREQAGSAVAGDSTARLRELEEKLAASLRDHAELQTENTRLRTEIDRTRAENIALAEKLTAATARYGHAEAEVSQLNAELLAQKQARTRAEQAGDALRAQLSLVMSQASASAPSSLQLAKSPPAGASPTAELRVNTERLRSAPAATATPEPPARKHTVQTGDTLEQLSQRYYGAPDRWRAIYDANAALLDGGPLRPGMELTIPD